MNIFILENEELTRLTNTNKGIIKMTDKGLKNKKLCTRPMSVMQ